jgi:hypothetical protein
MNKNMKKRFILAMAFVLMSTSAFAYTFKGRVVDGETGKPIEGAVVVAHWNEEQATPTGPHTRLKEVKETLTDKEGRWKIRGPRGGEFGNVKAFLSLIMGHFTNRPEFIIFKPGYCSLPQGLYIDVCRKGIKKRNGHRTGDGSTIELPRLTKREDRIKGIPSALGSSEETLRKQMNLLRFINEESKNVGLSESEFYKKLLKE